MTFSSHNIFICLPFFWKIEKNDHFLCGTLARTIIRLYVCGFAWKKITTTDDEESKARSSIIGREALTNGIERGEGIVKVEIFSKLFAFWIEVYIYNNFNLFFSR